MEKGCYNKFNNYTHASFLSSTARVRLIAKTRIAIPGVARRQVARRRAGPCSQSALYPPSNKHTVLYIPPSLPLSLSLYLGTPKS